MSLLTAPPEAAAPAAVIERRAPYGPVARRWPTVLAGLASIVAGAVHLGAAVTHWPVWATEGIAFLAAGLVQAGVGLALLAGRRRPAAVAALSLVHLVAVVGWVVTRSVGWPAGPLAGEVEPVGVADAIAVVAAVVALVGARFGGPGRLPRARRRGAVVGGVAVVALLAPAVAVVPGLAHDPDDHAHGRELPADERADGLDLRRSPDDPTAGVPVAVGDGPVDVAWGHGVLWVASARDGSVTRVGPGGDVLGVIGHVADGVNAVAVGHSAVWVAAVDGTLARLDPDTGAVTGRVQVGRLAKGLDVAPDGTVFVTSAADGTISRVDPDTLAVTTAPTLPDVLPAFNGPGPSAVAVDGDVVWVVHTLRRELVRFDATTLEPIGEPAPTGGGATDVLVVGDTVWVPATTAGTLWRYDRETAHPIGDSIVVDARPEYGGGPYAVTSAFGSIWVANNDERTVTRIDAATGHVLGEPQFLANHHAEVPRPVGIVGAGDAVWVTDHDADRVVRLAPSAG